MQTPTFVGSWTSGQFNNNTGGSLSGRTSVPGNFVAITGSTNDPAGTTVTNSQTQSVKDSGLGFVNNGSDSTFIKYIEDIDGGALHIVSITTSASKFSTLNASEYSGVAKTNSLDRTATGTGNSTSLLTNATATTAQADTLIIGGGTISAGTNSAWTAGASFNKRGNITDATGGGVSFLEDRVVSSQTTYTASATWGGSAGAWIAAVATFRAASDAAATVTTAGTGNSTTSTATLAFNCGASFAVGDVLVVCIGADNAGTTPSAGVSSLTSVTDAKSHVYTLLQATFDPGAASAGITVGIAYTTITTAMITTDQVTLNFSPNTTSKAAVVYKIHPDTGNVIQFVTSGFTAGSTTGTPTVTTSSTKIGDIVIAALAAESNATVTGDSDVVGGAWTTQTSATANTGTVATSALVASQAKAFVRTVTTVQYDPTLTSCDNILGWVSFTPAFIRPVVNVLPSQAVHRAANW